MLGFFADVPAVAPSSVLRARNVASVLNLQKKRTPWEDIAWGTDAMVSPPDAHNAVPYCILRTHGFAVAARRWCLNEHCYWR